MTDVGYLCIDPGCSPSPTDAEGALRERSQNANKQNSRGLRVGRAWVPSLWATFSKETGQTQQTPNNYPLAYTEA